MVNSKTIAAMKNLFKNLMFVAVAAMAFTSCSKDNEEVNKVEKTTVYNFEATIAEDTTRSGFAEKENGATAYKSEWFGDEEIKVFAVDNNSGYSAEVTTTIDKEGKFSVELTDAPENFYISVRTPAESWSDEYSCTIPAEQTPLANSVDPKAHLLGNNGPIYVQNGVAEKIVMDHQAAYGKMTIKADEFAIDHVVVELNGSYYGFDRSLTYTINADNVGNNTFWFATEPIDVTDFTVTAYNSEGDSITKSVDVAAAGKTLAFSYGRVSTFSVSRLDAVEVPTVPAFTSAAWTNSSKSDKFINFYSDELGTLQLNFYNCNSEAWLDARTYGFANSGDIYPGGDYSYYVDATGVSRYVVSGSVTISIVDGEYYIEFNNLTDYDGSYSLTATYKGSISGLQLPDTREKLATPQPTATAEGKIIKISWEAVTGADEYYVFCYVGGLESITTTETSVEIEAEYATEYQFLIRAVANDSNPDYKTSDDYYFSVTTGKDPNKFAEYVATDLYWNNSAGSFEFVVDNYEIFRVKMNSADCPDHTTILEGEYQAVASSTIPAKSFSVYQKVKGGFAEGWSSTNTSSTMSVSYVDGEYVIIVDYIGKWGGSGEVGYKGVPEGWVVPGTGDSGDSGDGGDDSGDDNTGDGGDAVLGSESNPYTFTSLIKGQWTLEFTGAENGDRIVMDCNTTNVGAWIGDHGADTWIAMTKLLYGSGASIYGYNGEDYINSAFWGGSFVKVVKSGSEYTFTFNMSVDGGTTQTYYTCTTTL